MEETNNERESQIKEEQMIELRDKKMKYFKLSPISLLHDWLG